MKTYTHAEEKEGHLLERFEGGLGLTGEQNVYHDLDDLAGTWVDDPEFDKAIEEQHRIDPELWK